MKMNNILCKRLLLGGAVFVLAVVAYFVLSSRDRPTEKAITSSDFDSVRKFVTRPTTQGSQTLQNPELGTISPGDRTRIAVYDDVTGSRKYQFEATKWEPLSDYEFHVEELLIQIYTPKGEVTYISSSEADITLNTKSKKRVELQKGRLKGHVKVVVDRTTTQWREEHPDHATRETHPEELVNIDLENARFDMDRSELESKGAVLVDSKDVRLENVADLTVQWDQVDNRIELLRFAKGGKMTLNRGGDVVDFALPGTERKAGEKKKAVADATGKRPVVQLNVPRAQAMKPISIDVISAAQAVEQIRLESGKAVANRPVSVGGSADAASAKKDGKPLRGQHELDRALKEMTAEARTGNSVAPKPAAPVKPVLPPGVTTVDLTKSLHPQRVKTYQATFNNDVVVQQINGGQTVGKLEAKTLEVHFDFGKEQKRLAELPSGDQAKKQDKDKASISTSMPAVEVAKGRPNAPAKIAADEAEKTTTKLELVWNGPLELRPLKTDATEQTGKRFDVIAVGKPVKVHSNQGDAQCDQLVYRHERKQVWLSGRDDAPVEMNVDTSRKLIGREVFFDQQRGLARVEGAGKMIADRGSLGALNTAAVVDATTSLDAAKIDAGKVALVSANAKGKALSVDGAEVVPVKKASPPVNISWTRGVDIEIGTRPVTKLNQATGAMEKKQKEFLRRAWFHGKVEASQGEENVRADEMAVTFGTPRDDIDVTDYIENLNLSGDVQIARERATIAANKLDVDMVLGPDGKNTPSDIRAAENILILDPEHNLKVSKAETLKVTVKNGTQFSKATIVSPSPTVFAQTRMKDMAVHGHKIEIDMDEESIDVAGPGAAWMLTETGFGGMSMGKSTVVRTTWDGSMQMRLAKNYGVFLDNVETRSRAWKDKDASEMEEVRLKSDKLTMRFAKPRPVRESEKKDFLDRFAMLGEVVGKSPEDKFANLSVAPMERKPPNYIICDGHAELIHTDHARGENAKAGRLLSRMQIVGEQIAVDLEREQMSVPCMGSLLIEDYRFEDSSRNMNVVKRSVARGPLMSSMGNEGPSQTLIRWENAMDFFIDRSLVSFDRDVRMVHRSGQQLAMKDELAKAMDLQTDSLQHLKSGRLATLTCGNLLIEFLSANSSKKNSKSNSFVRATDLKRLIAKGVVHLQDGSKSLMGQHLQYLMDTNEVRLEGSDAIESRIVDQDEMTQRLTTWRGPTLLWNRETNEIFAPKARISGMR